MANQYSAGFESRFMALRMYRLIYRKYQGFESFLVKIAKSFLGLCLKL
jgi:hypothetical protein